MINRLIIENHTVLHFGTAWRSGAPAEPKELRRCGAQGVPAMSLQVLASRTATLLYTWVVSKLSRAVVTMASVGLGAGNVFEDLGCGRVDAGPIGIWRVGSRARRSKSPSRISSHQPHPTLALTYLFLCLFLTFFTCFVYVFYRVVLTSLV